MRDAIEDDMLPLETRIKLLEAALTDLQTRGLRLGLGSLGRCVNSQMHPAMVHPHWDAEFMTGTGL